MSKAHFATLAAKALKFASLEANRPLDIRRPKI